MGKKNAIVTVQESLIHFLYSKRGITPILFEIIILHITKNSVCYQRMDIGNQSMALIITVLLLAQSQQTILSIMVPCGNTTG